MEKEQDVLRLGDNDVEQHGKTKDYVALCRVHSNGFSALTNAPFASVGRIA